MFAPLPPPSKPSLVEITANRSPSPSLPERIYSQLKMRILNGTLPPSAHLLEKDLCDELSVSRTPLREALNRLGNEELVVFRPHYGYQVAPITSAGFLQLRDLRVIVETQVAVLACTRARPEQIEQLRDAAVMPDLIPGEDLSFVNFCQANARFHLLLVRMTGNTLLENIVMSALDQYQRPAYLGIGRVTDAHKASQCHLDIVQAVQTRDTLRAESAMSGHIMGGFDRIFRALQDARL
jgi:DNA-binding GntR family transcriptional regulator